MSEDERDYREMWMQALERIRKLEDQLQQDRGVEVGRPLSKTRRELRQERRVERNYGTWGSFYD